MVRKGQREKPRETATSRAQRERKGLDVWLELWRDAGMLRWAMIEQCGSRISLADDLE
jgi:hypothetical protein